MSCARTFHYDDVSETIFKLQKVGPSILLYPAVKNEHIPIGVQKSIKDTKSRLLFFHEWKCTKCNRKWQVYLEHCHSKGWKLGSNGKYTVANNILYKNF